MAGARGRGRGGKGQVPGATGRGCSQATGCLLSPHTSCRSRNANNPRVARNLRGAFPHPYTLGDARAWIALQRGERAGEEQRASVFCLAHQDRAASSTELRGEKGSNNVCCQSQAGRH